MKQSLALIVVAALIFTACKKKNKTDDEPQTPNWEIIQNFHQDDSYVGAKIAVLNGEVFFSTFGQMGIKPGSSGSLDNHLRGTFFYKIGADWYKYATTDEAIITYKVFNGALYGIRHLAPIKSTQPVLQHNNSYVLFRWENNNFKDIDTLEFTNANHIEKSNIGDITLWINNGKLHLVAATAHIARVWELNGNKLVQKTEELPLSYSHAIAVDNKEVAITQVIQNTSGQDRTEFRVRGHYYNGNSFSTGPEYTFIQDIGYNGKDASNYAAINSNIWGIGFEKYKIKNYDNNQLVSSASTNKILRGDILIGNNGKYYIMMGNEKNPGGCAGLAIFDGNAIKEVPFVLPEPLDPCSRLIDATEENGVLYLLLMNRFQYVIVKSKI